MGTHTANCLLQLYAASGRRRPAAPRGATVLRAVLRRVGRLFGR
jgi:hypothetical protein